MTRIAVLSLAVAALSALVGCVPPGSRQQGPSAMDDPSRGCFASIAYDSRFVPLREKIAVNLPPAEPTLEMLSDRSYPTDGEKTILSTLRSTRMECHQAGASFRAQYAPPMYEAQATALVTSTNNLIAKLYAREITYGEFNRLRSENATNFAIQGARESQRQAEIAQQQDAQRRAAVGAALINMQQQQQLQQQMLNQQIIQNRPASPTTTNCNRFGNQVNCTTY